MYFNDPKFGNYAAAAALKNKKNYTKITYNDNYKRHSSEYHQTNIITSIIVFNIVIFFCGNYTLPFGFPKKQILDGSCMMRKKGAVQPR